MSSLSKLRVPVGYASPFDEALSKPLIEQKDDNTSTRNSSTCNTDHNKDTDASLSSSSSSANPFQNQAAYAKLTPLSHDTYLPPPALLDEEQQETQQSLLYTQLTSATPQPLGTHIESALLSERHLESQHISIQMRQILEINQDLATLVSTQQETIDIIEDNAYEVHDRAERGVGHLQRAKGLMKNAMDGEGVMRIFFLVVAVGGLFLALVLLLEAIM